ncbi:PREDICTED: transcription termination factor 2-like, partial [Nestor notabilis]|uniref:transcription termination factor 2-like n=1 Tax=Nestor notabilis TaxID=176057 RepID=UPI000523C5F1
GSLCFLKTGVRDGPNKGKSFYVCGAQGSAACGFVLPAPIPVSHCLIHEGCVVELQVLVQVQDTDEYQLFYRCLKSKLNGKKWCGSIPWQDPKATKVSKAVESHPSTVPLFNPSGQRNPFKVIDKNCEPSSWKQMKQGNREESKANGVKAEKESMLVSHKEKKSTSDSCIEKEPLEGLKTEKQAKGNGSDLQRKENIVSESKLDLSEAWKNTILEEEKYDGGGRESRRSSECVEKEPGGRSKPLPLSLGKQSTTTKPPEEEQLGEESLKSCGDKETREKEYVSWKNGEMKPMSEDVISGALPQLALQHAALKSGAEAHIRPGLGQSTDQVSGSDSDDVDYFYSSLSKSKPEKSVVGLQSREIPSGKSAKSVEGTALPGAAASHDVKGPQDPKALHNHLVVQLKQKKSTLATVNIQLLPDKGERLLKQVQDLEAALSALNVSTAGTTEKGEDSISSSCREESLPNPFGRPGGTKLITPLPLQDPTARTPSGSQSHPSAAALGSSEYYSHSFGMNSGAQNLYGGRMTEDRIRAVRSAISEAVNNLHKSLDSCPREQTAAEDPSGLK